MRIWKQFFSCLLAGAMTLSLAACGQSGADNSTGAQSSGQVQQEPAETPPPVDASENTAAPEASAGENTADSGSVLVVYYSASGHTETVAGYIAQATGGDIFEITPAQPYTDDDLNWTDENSRVVYEYENPEARDVELAQSTPADWADYDVVFIGYPIWWGIAAWPVDGFVEANDFTGKTVIPFCTSSSSGLGESGELLAELAGTGDWQEGQRFRSSAGQADVDEWVDSLGLSAE